MSKKPIAQTLEPLAPFSSQGGGCDATPIPLKLPSGSFEQPTVHQAVLNGNQVLPTSDPVCSDPHMGNRRSCSGERVLTVFTGIAKKD